MATSAPQSRAREQPQGEEDAGAKLKLGDFQQVPALTLSEARLVINVVMDSRRQKKQEIKETEVLLKTTEYLEIFARFKQKENIEAVERILAADDALEPFERAQLGSLCCETAEEARTLVPSLVEKKDEELQELLDEISKLRNYIE
ncbi:MAG: RNA polymerase B [Peltula sp. TS41687]|nr:MAG: RNA polymerase B [Peltula sp. TS41687]